MDGGWSRWSAAIAAVLVTGAVTGEAARAATLVVNTSGDGMASGDGLWSLREAISSVNSPGSASPDCVQPDASNNTISLAAGSYKLTIAPGGGDDNSTGDLNVGGTVTGLTVSGAGSA